MKYSVYVVQAEVKALLDSTRSTTKSHATLNNVGDDYGGYHGENDDDDDNNI